MKVAGYVRAVVAISMILNQTVIAADGDSNQNPPKQETRLTSKKVMREAMNDPIAREAFHETQMRMLQTPGDAMMRNFYRNNPHTAKLYQFLINNNDALLAGFELGATSRMVLLRPGLTDVYDVIYNRIVKVASDYPVSDEAIQNMQVYIQSGDENAYTVSGSRNKLIMVLQKGILKHIQGKEGRLSQKDIDALDLKIRAAFEKTFPEKDAEALKELSKTIVESTAETLNLKQRKNHDGMTVQELTAVFGHELGHIMAEHTVKGVMNSIMLSIVGEFFVNGTITDAAMDSEELAKLIHKSYSQVCVHKDHNHEHSALTAETLAHLKNQKFIDTEIKKFVSHFKSMNKNQLQLALGSFLNTMIGAIQFENAPMGTLAYFQGLLENLGRIGMLKFDAKDFSSHAKQAQYALSRGKEKTADNIASSEVRNEYSASAFAKLIGMNFDRETRENIFDQIRSQAETLLANIPPELMSIVAGSTHPSLVLRVNNMLTIPSYPTILFANPYVRNLLINESLILAEEGAREILESTNANLAAQQEALLASAEEMKKNGATEEVIQGLLEKKAQEFERIRTEAEQNMITVSQSRQKHEANVMSLLFSEDFPATAAKSPRMSNIIQFLSVQKEMALLYVAKIEDLIQNPQMAQKAEMLKASKAGLLRAIALKDEFLSRVQARMFEEGIKLQALRDSAHVKSEKISYQNAYNNLHKRYILLSRILKADSFVELEKVRARVTGIDPEVRSNEAYRRNKIPTKLEQTEAYEKSQKAKGAKEVPKAPIAPLCPKLF